MRKSTLIISVILTAAVLYALYNLVEVYRESVPAAAVAAVPVTVTAEATPELPTPVPTETPMVERITIYEAGAVAVKVLGRNDLYLVENSSFDGADAYLATFLSGDMLYIGLDGNILSASKGAAIVIRQPASHDGR